jgi:beta-mannosidase
VTEFGAQAIPEDAAFMAPERWPALDWSELGRRHSLQKAIFDRYVPPAEYGSFDEWREATQQYQATVVKHHIETLRRLKYRPAGGFAQFCFADAMPAVTWSVLGHDRAPKLGYTALRDACRPVIVVADRLAASVRPGDALALDVHVVSDLRTPLDGVVAHAHLSWPGPGGEHEWRWQGDVPADDCVRVGTIQFVVPDAADGSELVLALETTGPAVARATNRYTTRITSP